MNKVAIIIGATRAERRSLEVETWIQKQWSTSSKDEFSIIDLKDINLPFFR